MISDVEKRMFQTTLAKFATTNRAKNAAFPNQSHLAVDFVQFERYSEAESSLKKSRIFPVGFSQMMPPSFGH